MRRRDVLIGTAVSGLVMAGPGALIAAPPPQPRLPDMLTEFWRIWARAKRSGDTAEYIFRHYVAANKAIYAGAQVTIAQDQVRQWLPDFIKLEGQVREVSRRIPPAYRGHEAGFKSVFSDFEPARSRTVFLISFGSFDGRSMTWDGVPSVFFGADMIAKLYGPKADLKVLFDHESFHVYHAQANPEFNDTGEPTLYQALWAEGLATYLSERLNPGASLADILLDKTLASAPAGEIGKAAREILPILESREQADYARFFFADQTGIAYSRMGYLLGLAVARAIGAGQQLPALARRNGVELKQAVKEQLARLAA
ncbi:MAG: hypothetical protein JSR96_02300 [Proteobacteria bacterium]|nr:hypothetical protein [Pseudomonadota bacterium]